MKLATFIAAAVVATAALSAAWAQAPETATQTAPAGTPSAAVLLEKAIYTEETVGDLDAAIKLYRQIVSDAKANRKYAAQAQYRLAMCYLKKGDKAKAQQELRMLLATYPQEKDIAAHAQRELAKLSQARAPAFGRVIEKVLPDKPVRQSELLDLDTGRFMAGTDFGENDRETHAWIRQEGLDVMGFIEKGQYGVLAYDMAALPVSPDQWDKLTPEALLDNKQLAHMEPGKITPLLPTDTKQEPPTYLFRTREGGHGIVQLLGESQEPRGVKIRYKLLEHGAAVSADAAPRVVKTSPAAFANDVDPSLDKITVTFDRAMTDGSWSWTGGGDTYPQMTGRPYYDASKTTCAMPVKLQPGKVYWVGINSPSHRNFKSAEGTPARRYVVLFATRSPDGRPTPLPEDLVKRATEVNTASSIPTASAEDVKGAENLSAEGWGLLNERKLPEAEKKFKAAVEKDPTNANAWNGLGWAQFNQGKALNARESFTKAIAIEPKRAAALNGLGWVAKKEGNTKQAIEYWEEAVTAAPSATAALNGLAATYCEQGQYDKAAEYYRMWMKAEPNNADVKAGLEKAERARNAVKAAVPAAEAWLKVIDAGKYEQSWDEMAKLAQSAVTKDQWAKDAALLKPFGPVQSRKLLSAVHAISLPGAPDGDYVTIEYDSAFANKKQAVETVTVAKDTDGTWRVGGYFVR